MGNLFSVVLSAAKDLIAARHRHEILRFAQDDRGAHPRAATKVSATKVFPLTHIASGNCGNPRDSQRSSPRPGPRSDDTRARYA
jgi:hypothetical protein